MSNEKKVFHDYLKVAFGENATVKEENDVNKPFNFVVNPLPPTESTFTDSHRMDHYPLADNRTEDEIINLCRDILDQGEEQLIEGSEMFITKENIQWNLFHDLALFEFSFQMMLQSTLQEYLLSFCQS